MPRTPFGSLLMQTSRIFDGLAFLLLFLVSPGHQDSEVSALEQKQM